MEHLADAEYAAKIVSMLVHSYPNQAHDPEVFQKQMIIVCSGRPRDLLKRLVHPTEGILAKTKFLPSIAEVKEWLDERSGNQPAVYPLLPPAPEKEPLTDAERDAILAKQLEVREILNSTTKRLGGKRKPLPSLTLAMLTPEQKVAQRNAQLREILKPTKQEFGQRPDSKEARKDLYQTLLTHEKHMGPLALPYEGDWQDVP